MSTAKLTRLGSQQRYALHFVAKSAPTAVVKQA